MAGRLDTFFDVDLVTELPVLRLSQSLRSSTSLLFPSRLSNSPSISSISPKYSPSFSMSLSASFGVVIVSLRLNKLDDVTLISLPAMDRSAAGVSVSNPSTPSAPSLRWSSTFLSADVMHFRATDFLDATNIKKTDGKDTENFFYIRYSFFPLEKYETICEITSQDIEMIDFGSFTSLPGMLTVFLEFFMDFATER